MLFRSQQNQANADFVILDVRTSQEFAGGHISGAVNLNFNAPDFRSQISALDKSRTYLVYCQSGNRSRKGCNQLLQNGHTDPLAELAGGIPAWQQAGRPLRQLKNAPLPLMRQVQIAAGSLVLLGLILSKTVAPAWIALTWFVGAGLVFAGVSGFCGMARLLAAMPWNRVSL